jgi:hypothetical protein
VQWNGGFQCRHFDGLTERTPRTMLITSHAGEERQSQQLHTRGDPWLPASGVAFMHGKVQLRRGLQVLQAGWRNRIASFPGNLHQRFGLIAMSSRKFLLISQHQRVPFDESLRHLQRLIAKAERILNASDTAERHHTVEGDPDELLHRGFANKLVVNQRLQCIQGFGLSFDGELGLAAFVLVKSKRALGTSQVDVGLCAGDSF